MLAAAEPLVRCIATTTPDLKSRPESAHGNYKKVIHKALAELRKPWPARRKSVQRNQKVKKNRTVKKTRQRLSKLKSWDWHKDW